MLRIFTTIFIVFMGVCMTPWALAAPPAKAFGELPIIYDAAISPKGDKIAFIANIKGEYSVITQNYGDDDVEPNTWRLSLGKEAKPLYVRWVNDGRFVISLNKPESYRGTPFSMGYLFTGDVNTREGKILIVPKRMFRQFNNTVVDWLDDDPEHILMAFSDEEFERYPDIKKVNLTTGRYKTVQKGRLGVQYWVTDKSGLPRIGSGRIEGGDKRMVIFNKTTEKWESVSKYPGLEVDTRIFSFIGSGNEIVIGDYRGKDTLGLYVYNLDKKAITRKVFHNDKYDASSVVLSKESGEIIGAKYTADRDKTELFDGYGTILSGLRRKYSDYNVDLVDQTHNGDSLLIKMSAPYSSGALLAFEKGDTDLVRLSAMYNGLPESEMGEVISVKYKARDGQEIPAFVTVPKAYPAGQSLKNLPFIVLPHGGPYARDEKRFDYFAQFFASRGYGVLQMNFRGSDGYGKTFSDAGRDNWIVMQEDVTDGTKWLYAKGIADPTKTCIAGWSFGGYASLMGAAKHSDLYQCSIAMAALTDVDDAKRDLRKYRDGRAAAKEFFGDAMKDKDVRRANSPVKVADQINIPVFLAHGDSDQNVQFDQFTRMKKALEKAGVDGTYLAFEDEDHFLSRQENREKFFVELEKFLIKVNGRNKYVTP